jgi:hypothetical protein
VAAKGKPKVKPRKRQRTQTTDPAQSARFLAMAKNLGLDKSDGQALDRVVGAMAKKQKKGKGDPT